MDRHGEYTCCICGRKFIGWGNNPWPVNNEDGVKCCDECNATVVVPARLKEIFSRQETSAEETAQETVAEETAQETKVKKNGKKSD